MIAHPLPDGQGELCNILSHFDLYSPKAVKFKDDHYGNSKNIEDDVEDVLPRLALVVRL